MKYRPPIYRLKRILKVFVIVFFLIFTVSGVFSGIVTLTASQKEAHVFYATIEELAISWGGAYKTTDREKSAIIMSTIKDGQRVYFVKRTYTGKEKSVRSGSFAGYYNFGLSCLFTEKRMEGSIHTHPYKNPEFVFSNASRSDAFSLYMPGINAAFVVFPSGEVGQYYKDGRTVSIFVPEE